VALSANAVAYLVESRACASFVRFGGRRATDANRPNDFVAKFDRQPSGADHSNGMEELM
jgi:hypothetical protein